jgi:transposase
VSIMSGNGKRYNKDFREMIVELYQTGSSVADLSREYGVTKVTIYKWIKQYSEIEIAENTTVTKKEMLEIQRENKKLKEELAILKKALSIFADK